MKLLSFFIITFFTFSSVAKADIIWVDSSGISCAQTCMSKKSSPVISGTYQNGNNFYVCATNAENEGFRAGYNLAPIWSAICVVGWGGKEKSYNSYRCLCEN